MSNARTGSLIGATWLIGLGIVFLVQRAADLPWSQAWPMFVILVGVAGFVSAIIRGRWDYARPVGVHLAGRLDRRRVDPAREHDRDDRGRTERPYQRVLAMGSGHPRACGSSSAPSCPAVAA